MNNPLGVVLRGFVYYKLVILNVKMLVIDIGFSGRYSVHIVLSIMWYNIGYEINT